MDKSKASLFSDGPVSRAVLSLALPTVISQMITVVYNMADTFFVGQLNDPPQVAAAGTLLLYFLAVPIAGCFIADTETVMYGQRFLKIICLACPTTAINFMVITIFQAVGQRAKPLFLSLLRKGSVDILLMVLLNRSLGLGGIAWATPAADWIACGISLSLLLPFLRKITGSPLPEEARK